MPEDSAGRAQRPVVSAEEWCRLFKAGEICRADRDGYCDWEECPQLRNSEPLATGRHCPMDIDCEEI